MRQQSLGEVERVIVYCTVPVLIDGDRVEFALEDDGMPGLHGDVWDYNLAAQWGEGWRMATAEETFAAWDLVKQAIEEQQTG